MNALEKSVVTLIRSALEEDIGKGDLTTLACLEPDPVSGTIIAKSDGVLSGVIPATLAFHIIDSANELRFLKKDGDRFKTGDTIMKLSGFNQTVLTSERVALNFLSHLSGVATLTRRFVDLVKSVTTDCKVLDTRKTTPGFRYLEKQAVLHGGGVNHRFGLYDMVLIKDNHIASAGSITKAVERTRQYLGTPDFRLQFETSADKIKIEVEVASEAELKEAIGAGVDRILIDNQTPDSLKKFVLMARELDPKVELEASGNVNLETVVPIASSGVDFISIGAMTHSAPVSDFSLLFKQ